MDCHAALAMTEFDIAAMSLALNETNVEM